MRRLSVASSIFISAALALLTSSADHQRASAQVNDRTPPPGEGVLCAWAIYAAIATVGQKCHPGEDPEFQSALGRTIARFDAYVLANSTPSATPAWIDAFKRQQGSQDTPTAALCANKDAENMYQALLKAGANEIRKSTDELLARPGNPEWGTCL